MIKLKPLVLMVLTVFTVGLVACGADEPKVSKTLKSNTQLQYIPGDSPYVFAMLEPMPQAFADKLSGRVDSLLAGYKGLIEMYLAEEEVDSEGQKMADLLMAKFLSIEGLNSIGLNGQSTYVLFGHGLLPVLRVTLSDGDLMRDFITELEQQVGEKFSVSEIAGQAYWHSPDDEKMQLLTAIVGNELVMTLVPSAGSESLYKSLLGLQKPSNSMAESTVLSGIMEKHGYLPVGVGVIDVTKLTETFLGEATGVNAELLAMGDYDASKISQVCKTEIREMAGIMPQLVTGYTKLDDTEMVTDMVLEIRPDLATSLSGIAAPVPGLGVDLDGLLAFGASFDIPHSIEFMKARIAAVEADPYECEYFSEMQTGLNQMKASLSAPMPPFVTGFKGFNLIFDGLEFDGMMPKPESVKARGIIAMDNAPEMLTMAQFFRPELADLAIEPDGKPVALDANTVPGLSIDAFMAMEQDKIAMSIGNGSDSKLPGMLSAKSKEVPPIMSMSYDVDAYMDVIMKFVEMGLQEDENLADDEDIERARRSMKLIIDPFQGLFDKTKMDIAFTEQGLKLEQYVSFK